jgi:hypothetical protein
MTMQLIETKTLGTDAASIEFTSIPQDGTDLLLKVSARSTRASGFIFDSILVTFNGSAVAQYSSRILLAQGASVSSLSESSVARLGFVMYANAAGSTSNTFSNAELYIPNYTSNANKSTSSDSVTENNATSSILNISAGLWANTAAITQITCAASDGNLTADSVFSLYKITKGSGGATVS